MGTAVTPLAKAYTHLFFSREILVIFLCNEDFLSQRRIKIGGKHGEMRDVYKIFRPLGEYTHG